MNQKLQQKQLYGDSLDINIPCIIIWYMVIYCGNIYANKLYAPNWCHNLYQLTWQKTQKQVVLVSLNQMIFYIQLTKSFFDPQGREWMRAPSAPYGRYATEWYVYIQWNWMPCVTCLYVILKVMHLKNRSTIISVRDETVSVLMIWTTCT